VDSFSSLQNETFSSTEQHNVPIMGSFYTFRSETTLAG